MINPQKCIQCSITSAKVRLYGPGKTPICYECAHNPDTPELTAIAAMYEKAAIRDEIETKLQKLREVFPGAKIFQVGPDKIAEFILPSDGGNCDCAVCSFARELNKNPPQQQH